MERNLEEYVNGDSTESHLWAPIVKAQCLIQLSIPRTKYTRCSINADEMMGGRFSGRGGVELNLSFRKRMLKAVSLLLGATDQVPGTHWFCCLGWI